MVQQTTTITTTDETVKGPNPLISGLLSVNAALQIVLDIIGLVVLFLNIDPFLKRSIISFVFTVTVVENVAEIAFLVLSSNVTHKQRTTGIFMAALGLFLNLAMLFVLWVPMGLPFLFVFWTLLIMLVIALIADLVVASFVLR